VDHPGGDPGEDASAGEGNGTSFRPVRLVSVDYAAMTTGQLADLVEFAYSDGAVCDWELVFELARRALAADPGRPNSHR